MNFFWLGCMSGIDLRWCEWLTQRSHATDLNVAARVAQRHLFAGLPVEETGEALGLSRAMAYRNWKYARAWLHEALKK